MDSLCNTIEQNTEIKILDVSGYNLSLERIGKIAEALKKNNILEIIKFNQCCLGDNGVKLIAEALAENTMVKELWLNGNNIDDEGAGHIGQLLRNKKNISGLFLADNSITGIGVMHLVWQVNPEIHKRYIKQLDLEKNPIGYLGVCYLALMLNNNNTLEWLKIGMGHINDAGFIQIAGALRTNKGLKYLSFKNCNELSEFRHNGEKVGAKGWICLQDALNENTTLIGCNLPKDEMEEEIWKDIEPYVRRYDQYIIKKGLENKLRPLGRHVMPCGTIIPGVIWTGPVTEALANNQTGKKELMTLLWIAKVSNETQRQKREREKDTQDEEKSEKKTCVGIKPQSLIEHAKNKSSNVSLDK